MAPTRTLFRDNALGPEALRAIVRDVGFSLARRIPVQTLVVIVRRNGHTRMASWASPEMSRLDVGLAEARAYRAWSSNEPETSARVVTLPLSGGVARFELRAAVDEYLRSKLGLAGIRLAAAINAADAIDFGDGALHGDAPGVAVLDETGHVRRANRVFEVVTSGAPSLESLGTSRADRALLRQLIDDALLGVSNQTNVHIGPTARAVLVRCGAPLAGVVVAVLSDDRPRTIEPVPRHTGLPMLILDRATLRPLDANHAGKELVGDGSLVSALAAEDRLPMIDRTVGIGAEPEWLGPFSLADGTRIELAAVSAQRQSTPSIAALIHRLH